MSSDHAQLGAAYENLGKVCERLGLYEEAVNAYVKMVNIEIPSGPDLNCSYFEDGIIIDI